MVQADDRRSIVGIEMALHCIAHLRAQFVVAIGFGKDRMTERTRDQTTLRGILDHGQAMALGEVTIKDWWNVMRREIFSGIFLGTTLCLLSFCVIAAWQIIMPGFNEHYIRIGLVVGCSLVGVVLWGTLMGSMLPLLLKKLGADPAASSTPFVATLVDVTGLIIYFAFAFLFLRGVLL